MTSRRELKNYAKQAMSGKYGILILAFVAVQALALISSMISSALFPGEETFDIVLSYAFTFILTLLIKQPDLSPIVTREKYLWYFCRMLPVLWWVQNPNMAELLRTEPKW